MIFHEAISHAAERRTDGPCIVHSSMGSKYFTPTSENFGSLLYSFKMYSGATVRQFFSNWLNKVILALEKRLSVWLALIQLNIDFENFARGMNVITIYYVYHELQNPFESTFQGFAQFVSWGEDTEKKD